MANKSSAKKASASKPAKKKSTTKKKTAAKKAPTKSRPRLAIDELSASAQRLMLANLGLYGQVLDELQHQLERARTTVQQARKHPSKTNEQLVSRGEKLLDQVRDLLQRSGAPITKQLDKQMKEFREALKKLKKNIQA